MSRWQPLPDAPTSTLVDARLQLHFATQLIASVADTLLPRAADDSQSALTYEADHNRFCALPVEIDGHAPAVVVAALVIPELQLQLCNADGTPFAVLPLHGETMQNTFDWLNQTLSPPTPIERRQFPDFPEHALGDGAPFARPERLALRLLDLAYHNTALLLKDLRERFGVEASPIRVWPHHFDMAVMLTLSTAGQGQYINVGFSPGDEAISGPYWYVSPWPTPPHDGPGPELEVGDWQESPWFGAAAGLTEVVSHNDPEGATNDFLLEAVSHSRTLFSDISTSPDT